MSRSSTKKKNHGKASLKSLPAWYLKSTKTHKCEIESSVDVVVSSGIW